MLRAQASVKTARAQNMTVKTSYIKMVAKQYKPSLGENGVRFPQGEITVFAVASPR